jgi:beta-barrel assembly-enhancing protease
MYRSQGRSVMPRLIIAAIIALFSIISYFSMTSENPITGESDRVALSQEEEIALGLQAMPEMAHQFGGEHPDPRAQRHVDDVGARLLAALDKSLREQGRKNPYPFEFHLLADDETINAFALPGGQVSITAALYRKLETEAQLAGVIGHEIGHVLARHGAQQLAKQQLTQGLSGAAGVAGGDVESARMAQAVGHLVNMSYGREDELESDKWGVKLMGEAGYDPRALLGVMKILDEASQGAPPEFLSSHPKPANRARYIEEVIAEVFPDGVPENLEE